MKVYILITSLAECSIILGVFAKRADAQAMKDREDVGRKYKTEIQEWDVAE